MPCRGWTGLPVRGGEVALWRQGKSRHVNTTMALVSVWTFSCIEMRAAAPDTAVIERLVQQLGSDDFHERETASQRLESIGAPALEALRKAATNDDPEVRHRARKLIVSIGNGLFPE